MRNRLAGAGWLMLASTLLVAPAFAGEPKTGREKALACVVCHGELGIAVAPNAPNLAGENAVYIREQLMAFKSGKRKHEQMSIIAQGLEEADIDDLASWYAAIKVEATAPELD